jgi:hypothetical protein
MEAMGSVLKVELYGFQVTVPFEKYLEMVTNYFPEETKAYQYLQKVASVGFEGAYDLLVSSVNISKTHKVQEAGFQAFVDEFQIERVSRWAKLENGSLYHIVVRIIGAKELLMVNVNTMKVFMLTACLVPKQKYWPSMVERLTCVVEKECVQLS